MGVEYNLKTTEKDFTCLDIIQLREFLGKTHPENFECDEKSIWISLDDPKWGDKFSFIIEDKNRVYLYFNSNTTFEKDILKSIELYINKEFEYQLEEL